MVYVGYSTIWQDLKKIGTEVYNLLGFETLSEKIINMV